jgi:hypothetical protein
MQPPIGGGAEREPDDTEKIMLRISVDQMEMLFCGLSIYASPVFFGTIASPV